MLDAFMQPISSYNLKQDTYEVFPKNCYFLRSPYLADWLILTRMDNLKKKNV